MTSQQRSRPVEVGHSFAFLVRSSRRRASLTQQELAQLSGLSVRTIRNLELGRTRRPHPDSVRLLADTFGLDGRARETFADLAAGHGELPAGLDLPPASSTPAAGRIRPAQLPADVAAFTGRAEHLQRLDSLLPAEESARSTAVVISAIAGTAGVGKTALALHWAHRVCDRFPDGSLFANLRGFDPRSAPVQADEVLDGFLRALGVRPEAIPPTVDQRSALFRTLLDGRRVLLVLDNAARSEQVRQLLPGAPGCMVVVTSRSRLTGLVAGSSGRRITVNLLPPSEAVALLRAVLGADRTDAEPQATAELARLCAYLPLALRLVAERATTRPYLPLASLVREVAASGDDRLDLLSADDDETTAVRAAFSWSYRALTPDAARMFRLLGLHPGPDISLAAAAALSGVDRDEARRLLGTLTGVHLLEETGWDRYRFHDLLGAYARDRAQAEEPEHARSRGERQVLAWYLRTADAADRMLMPGRRHIPLDPPTSAGGPPELAGAGAALEWCESERVNLVAATRRAAEIGDHATAWKLPLALWSFFAIRKRWADWITTHRVALTAARYDGDRIGEAMTCTGLAHAYRDLQRFEEAIDHFRQALGICQEIGEQWVEAATLSLLGIAWRDLGRFDDAIECSQRALGIFEATGDRWGTGWTLYSLGEIYKDLRRFDAAIDCSQEALATFSEIDDSWGRSWTLSVLGQACRNQGRLDEAIDYSRQALAAAQEIGNQQGEGLALYTLGKALRDIGKIHAARQAWQQALTTFENLGAPQVERVRERLQGLDAVH